MRNKTTIPPKKIPMSDLAIRLVNVSKRYTIHHEKPTLVEHLIQRKHEEFWALSSINLEVKKGERVGIIGLNGSGKTTLLKIIAGITSPSSGRVETQGKLVSLIDLEAGFHMDLTGIENIYLNGMFLGMKKKEIEHKLRKIIAFADIGQFIDAPLFTYSEGMKLRLGFSVAVHVDPDILLLDEGIGAGDEEFKHKTSKKIQEFYREGKTVIVATHWLDFLKTNAQRVLIMQHGKKFKDGSLDLIEKYLKKY